MRLVLFIFGTKPAFLGLAGFFAAFFLDSAMSVAQLRLLDGAGDDHQGREYSIGHRRDDAVQSRKDLISYGQGSSTASDQDGRHLMEL